MPYAISTTLQYLAVLLAFFLGLAATGINLTQFTILAGAFGLGIGFGLQNVVNGFVSGLILLYERPVQVGDVVQIADLTGTMRRIGIRSPTTRADPPSKAVVERAPRPAAIARALLTPPGLAAKIRLRDPAHASQMRSHAGV